MNPDHNITMCDQSGKWRGNTEKYTRKYIMGGLLWGNTKSRWKWGRVVKKIVNKISEINLINNNTTRLHITVNRDGIADSGSTIYCYLRDTPTYNYRTEAELHAVKPDGYQIVSTFEANTKVSTLNKEDHRGYKFPYLTQNLVSLTVLEDIICTIILYKTRIN